MNAVVMDCQNDRRMAGKSSASLAIRQPHRSIRYLGQYIYGMFSVVATVSLRQRNCFPFITKRTSQTNNRNVLSSTSSSFFVHFLLINIRTSPI